MKILSNLWLGWVPFDLCVSVLALCGILTMYWGIFTYVHALFIGVVHCCMLCVWQNAYVTFLWCFGLKWVPLLGFIFEWTCLTYFVQCMCVFTHFSILCLTMPWHAPPRHPLGTPHASPAALTCISSCTHMHSHLFHELWYCLHVLTVIACCFKFVMLCFKHIFFWLGTNLNLIKFCVCAPISLFSAFMCRCLLPNIQLLRDQP